MMVGLIVEEIKMDDLWYEQIALMLYFICWTVLLLLQLKKSDSSDDKQQLIDARKSVRKDLLYDHINFRMDGYLYKKNNFMFWKKRKFVLFGYELKYFEELNHNNLVWKGTFDIRNYKVISEVSTTTSGVSTQLDFNLVESHYANKPIMRRLSTSSNLELNLRAVSEDEKNLWVQVLNRQINAFDAAKNSYNSIIEPINRITNPNEDTRPSENYHLLENILPHPKEITLEDNSNHIKKKDLKESTSKIINSNSSISDNNDRSNNITPNRKNNDSFASLASLAQRELDAEDVASAKNSNATNNKLSTATIVNGQLDKTKAYNQTDTGFDINTFTKSGKLTKRGSNYKTWKLRTFVLKGFHLLTFSLALTHSRLLTRAYSLTRSLTYPGNELKYFDNNYNLKGQFDITDCTIMELNNEKAEGLYTFVLTESQTAVEERNLASKKKPASTSIFKSFIMSKPPPTFLRRSLYLRASNSAEMDDWIAVLHRQVFAINCLVRNGKVEVISTKNNSDNTILNVASPTSDSMTPTRISTTSITDSNYSDTAAAADISGHDPSKLNEINYSSTLKNSPENNNNYITKVDDHLGVNEMVMLASPVKLFNAFNRSSKRVLVLTDKPRLMILDLSCETILGEIFWSDDATGLYIDKLDDFNFKISTEDREYKFFDSDITANQWYSKITQVNERLHLFSNRSLNDKDNSATNSPVSPETRRRSITGDDEDCDLDYTSNNQIIPEFLSYEVKKKSISGISYKLWLVLTDTPRIYLVDTKTKKVFDDIYWPQTHVLQLDETSFKIISEDKEEIFWDDYNGSEIWISHFKSLSKSLSRVEELGEKFNENGVNHTLKYLKNDEEVIFKSTVRKYKHIGLSITVRRELVITNKNRMIYFDPKSKMLLGEINLNPEGAILPTKSFANDSLGLEKVNDFQFKIILEEKELLFIDDYHGSQFWIELIEKHIIRNKV